MIITHNKTDLLLVNHIVIHEMCARIGLLSGNAAIETNFLYLF